MNRDQAIKHILEVCEALKGFVHWQVTARCVLASLHHDARLRNGVREEIARLISYGKLYDHDYLLKR